MLSAVIGCSGRNPTVTGVASATAVAVRTVTVVERALERTSTQPATVHPFYRAEIRSRASGYAAEVKADLGDFVKAGATLAVISVPELLKQREVLEARVRQLEAEEQRAEAGVELAAANVLSMRAKLSQAQSEVQRAEASLAAAEAEFSRTQDMVTRQSLQDRILDEVRKRRDAELAGRDVAISGIRSAQADVTVAEARRSSARADLQATRAETEVTRRSLDELDVQIDFATLKAPFDGIVTERSLDPGDLVRESSDVQDHQPLFVVSRIDTVRVQIPVPEADAAWVRRGNPIRLSFPSFSDEQPIETTVTRLSGALDPSTRSMLVEADVANPQMKLIPGMFGQARMTLETKITSNVLPARAIRFRESGQAYVYIVGDDETVSVTPITTGIDNGHSIQVLGGVRLGQRIVDAHLQRFRDGQKVRILPEFNDD